MGWHRENCHIAFNVTQFSQIFSPFFSISTSALTFYIKFLLLINQLQKKFNRRFNGRAAFYSPRNQKKIDWVIRGCHKWLELLKVENRITLK